MLLRKKAARSVLYFKVYKFCNISTKALTRATKNEAKNDDVDIQIVGFKIKGNGDVKVNKSEDSQAKSVDFKARSELLKVLESSSCKKLPKQQQNIYGCYQGHLLCQN